MCAFVHAHLIMVTIIFILQKNLNISPIYVVRKYSDAATVGNALLVPQCILSGCHVTHPSHTWICSSEINKNKCSPKKTCTEIPLAALFRIDKKWKQPNCSSSGNEEATFSICTQYSISHQKRKLKHAAVTLSHSISIFWRCSMKPSYISPTLINLLGLT